MIRVLVALLLLPALPLTAAEFHVSPTGRDSDPGTKARPFASLERARDAVRDLRAKGDPSPATVWIASGKYSLDRTFELTADDSNTTYRSSGGEVRLIGGVEVGDFRPVSDPEILSRLDESARGNVLQADLKARGITDFGEMRPRGFGRSGQVAGLELFYRDSPMTLARWPNEGWAKIADVPDGPQGGKFVCESDRLRRWTRANDIHLHGYWTWDWADSYEKVKSVDPENGEIATEPPHGVYGYKVGARFRALNLLEELDSPGEWYLDRGTGILYFRPPEAVRSGDAYVSVLEGPMVSITDASGITIRGINFAFSRGPGIEIRGGSRNLIAGCDLRNLGTVGVMIEGGMKNGVLSCGISETGDGGVVLRGGDRKTLTPAGNFVRNTHIHHYNRWVKTYRPAVLITGVGNIIAHNLIHDSPHCAILLQGNEHIIEFNDISRVCRETGDAGAFYLGRDWTERGNVVRYNFFHDIRVTEGLTGGWPHVMAVYLDDWASGTRVHGNIFYKAGRAAMIGGGRNNTISNNIFVDCDPATHVDARGIGWGKYYFDGSNTTLTDRLNAMNYTEPPFSKRYPELLKLYDDEPAVPKYNVIERNIILGGKAFHLQDGLTDEVVTIKDNLVNVDPGFIDWASMDFRLRDDSPAYKTGFRRIPFERIGMFMDEHRTELPSSKIEVPKIRKLGTLECDMVEATPIVFGGRLYRFEYVRPDYKYNDSGDSYFRFVDVETGEPGPPFAEGFHLGSAHVEGDTVYVYGVDIWDGSEIRVFWSTDMKNWMFKTALNLPGWGLFNNSVCKGDGRYIMAFEVGKPEHVVGHRFTMRFAESTDLLTWTLMPEEYVFAKDRYTACPAIRYLDGWYYMIYLEARPGPKYEPHIVRTRDLLTWESSPRNPILHHSWEDRLIANPRLTEAERERIAKAVNINNSDVDICEFEGKTVIVYSWGNQQGVEHLAEAVYDGPPAEFLKSFFLE